MSLHRTHIPTLGDDDRLLTPMQAAEVLDTSLSTLARKRSSAPDGTPQLPFVRMGRKTIRYRMTDIRNYLKACTTA
jgi:hypothetical protein